MKMVSEVLESKYKSCSNILISYKLYKYGIHIFIGNKYEAAKYFDEVYPEERISEDMFSLDYSGVTIPLSNRICIIHIESYEDLIDFIEVLTHESIHAAYALLRSIGAHEIDEEHICYISGDIVNKTLNYIFNGENTEPEPTRE